MALRETCTASVSSHVVLPRMNPSCRPTLAGPDAVLCDCPAVPGCAAWWAGWAPLR